jgi:hypothetical protein
VNRIFLRSYLDVRLAIPSHDAPYFGRFDGHELASGEYRMFISCPDASALVEKLLPLLSALNWKGRVTVMKRYGEMRDASAREEVFEFIR